PPVPDWRSIAAGGAFIAQQAPARPVPPRRLVHIPGGLGSRFSRTPRSGEDHQGALRSLASASLVLPFLIGRVPQPVSGLNFLPRLDPRRHGRRGGGITRS